MSPWSRWSYAKPLESALQQLREHAPEGFTASGGSLQIHLPVSLLFDMKQQEVTAYSDPSERGYQARTTVPFGKSVYVPEPFGFELDTSAFTA